MGSVHIVNESATDHITGYTTLALLANVSVCARDKSDSTIFPLRLNMISANLHWNKEMYWLYACMRTFFQQARAQNACHLTFSTLNVYGDIYVCVCNVIVYSTFSVHVRAVFSQPQSVFLLYIHSHSRPCTVCIAPKGKPLPHEIYIRVKERTYTKYIYIS